MVFGKSFIVLFPFLNHFSNFLLDQDQTIQLATIGVRSHAQPKARVLKVPCELGTE